MAGGPGDRLHVTTSVIDTVDSHMTNAVNKVTGVRVTAQWEPGATVVSQAIARATAAAESGFRSCEQTLTALKTALGTISSAFTQEDHALAAQPLLTPPPVPSPARGPMTAVAS